LKPRACAYNPKELFEHPADRDDTRAGLLKIAALYTMTYIENQVRAAS
jgi:hypothetical protein